MAKAGFDYVGARIRDARVRSGLTLAELARGVGVSTSYISLVENGKSIPSLKILDKICTSLSMHLSTLFIDAENARAKKFFVFRRQGHIVVDMSDKRRLRVLLPKAKLPLEPVHLTILPDDEHDSLSTHKGIEFGYIVKGEVELVLKDEGSTICHTGDSFVYDAMTPHTLKNHLDEPAELVLVTLPNMQLQENMP